MTQYKNVSVHKYTSGPKQGLRFLKFGKGDSSGSDILLSTPDNDVDTMESMKRERVLVWSLPEPMTKNETKSYLEDNQPDPVWSALESEADR